MPAHRQPGTKWAREHSADSPTEAARPRFISPGCHAFSPPRARLHPTSAQTPPPPGACDPAGDQAPISDIAGEHRHSYGRIWDE
jgi:hypothetical protein